MSSIDLYDVLDVEEDCTQQEIIKAYRKLVKKYHPDKPSGDADLFELINLAFDTLKSKSKRREYDALRKLSKDSSKSHESRKAEFDEYNKLASGTVNETTEKQARIDFNTAFGEMDIKHKFKRTEEDMGEMTKEELEKLVEELGDLREVENIENEQDRIFEEGEEFDLRKFNEAFELAHSQGELTDMVLHDGNPDAMAFNGGQYSSYDSNYGDLYVEDPEENKFGLEGSRTSGLEYGVKPKKITPDQVKSLKGKSAVFDHNKVDEDYNKKLEDMMAERMAEREKDLNMKMSEYDTDPNMGGYGFLNEIEGSITSEIAWEDEDTLKDRYEKLLKYREKSD